jgi:hypothetical protein
MARMRKTDCMRSAAEGGSARTVSGGRHGIELGGRGKPDLTRTDFPAKTRSALRLLSVARHKRLARNP